MGKRKRQSLKEISSDKKKKLESKLFGNFTLPGFHYLGPGGEKSNGPPTNAVDAIAKKHDEAYDHAIDDFNKSHNLKCSEKEIKVADEKFLLEMKDVKVKTPMEAVGKVVGLAGIGIKAAVEETFGHTLYPVFDKKVASDVFKADNTKVRAGDDFN